MLNNCSRKGFEKVLIYLISLIIQTTFRIRYIPRRELFDVIDNLLQNKASGPEFVSSWAFNWSRKSIGTCLKFAIDECFSNNIFPDEIIKHISTIYNKGDPLGSGKYRPISATTTL